MDQTEAMELALAEAARAIEHDDVPIGAVLLDPEGSVVAADHNRRVELTDVTAHAEMLVLSTRSREVGDWRLGGHMLVVTLEPCAMCAMAAVWARIDTIVFGAADPRAGAVMSLYNVPQDERLNHEIEIVHGVRGDECEAILKEFFAARRSSGDADVPLD